MPPVSDATQGRIAQRLWPVYGGLTPIRDLPFTNAKDIPSRTRKTFGDIFSDSDYIIVAESMHPTCQVA
jgi:hypothetical protein